MAQRNLSRALVDDCLEAGRGETAAIREPKRVWTYTRLAAESMRAAQALRELGVQPGERVALLMHDSAELAATFLGAVRIGAVPVPLNVLLRPLELRTLLIHSGAVEVVASGDLADGVDSIRQELPTLRHLLSIGGAHPGQIDFGALCRDVEPWTNSHEPDDGAPAFLLYSGAQNGEPRAVAHDHHAPCRAFEAYARGVLHMGPADRVLSVNTNIFVLVLAGPGVVAVEYDIAGGKDVVALAVARAPASAPASAPAPVAGGKNAYDRAMAHGGVWEQRQLPCEQAGVHLKLKKNRKFDLSITTRCQADRNTTELDGLWSSEGADSLTLTFENPDGPTETMPCRFAACADAPGEECLSCQEEDVTFTLQVVRR